MPEFHEKKQSTYTKEIGRFAKHAAESNVGLFNHFKGVSVINGRSKSLPAAVQKFVDENIEICKPECVHICDGSDSENTQLLAILQKSGTIIPLPKYKNCWLARTDPADTARVESKTFISTENKSDTIPTPAEGVKGQLGNWLSPKDMDEAIQQRFPNCMKGRVMYVIPFSMGPVESPLSKYGIQLTDSAYVAASMRIMTRMGDAVMNKIVDGAPFVKCLHSVGAPADGKLKLPNWPCDPERTIILHRPDQNEIVSYGSGYGGNSLLGKKCFALRIGSRIAKKEGWLAEHMLILGITNPKNEKKYVVAAFPSACGKTNLAMMKPTLPGYKVECVGDDIAWMRFNDKGELRAINPENGFFGVAPGTSCSSNPVAMQTIAENTIFTNVAMTSDGGVYWEGLEKDVDPNVKITDWQGKPWEKGSKTPSSHPNSRFCTPAKQCPIIDPLWEDPEGVPISAILFGGRRPEGVPLVYEARDWEHGVLVAASMRSEATAAAEHKGKQIMHDPFAMRPFFGYNFGHYCQHWLDVGKKSTCLPKIYHVNWFRKSNDGKFLWPGFGENSRVLDWIIRRLDGENCYKETPIGNIPANEGGLNLEGLKESIDLKALFDIPKEYWLKETDAIQKYFCEQVGKDLPKELYAQLLNLRERLQTMNDNSNSGNKC